MFKSAFNSVRDHIPLEQGLRLHGAHSYAPKALVRDHIPLEQGLRPRPIYMKHTYLLVSETIFH